MYGQINGQLPVLKPRPVVSQDDSHTGRTSPSPRPQPTPVSPGTKQPSIQNRPKSSFTSTPAATPAPTPTRVLPTPVPVAAVGKKPAGLGLPPPNLPPPSQPPVERPLPAPVSTPKGGPSHLGVPQPITPKSTPTSSPVVPVRPNPGSAGTSPTVPPQLQAPPRPTTAPPIAIKPQEAQRPKSGPGLAPPPTLMLPPNLGAAPAPPVHNNTTSTSPVKKPVAPPGLGLPPPNNLPPPSQPPSDRSNQLSLPALANKAPALNTSTVRGNKNGPQPSPRRLSGTGMQLAIHPILPPSGLGSAPSHHEPQGPPPGERKKPAPPPPSRENRPTFRYERSLPQIPTAPTAMKPVKANVFAVSAGEKGTIASVYDLGETLGSGGFAEVVTAIHKQTKRKYACKIIDKLVTKEADAAALEMELRILREVKHNNIVAFEQSFETEDKLYVVLELMEGGELLHQLEEGTSNYSEDIARDIMRQIVSAVGHLHENKVIHRDLKPENLLFKEKTGTSTLKLIDFGMAKYLTGEPLTDWCGTPEYQAPEVVKRQGYNERADIWSLGVILFILLAGSPPFKDNNRMRLYNKIIKGDYAMPDESWNVISAEAKQLVKSLLVADPNTRPTCKQILSHAWFASHSTPAGAAAQQQFGENLKKYNVNRRFQNTGKQLMNCERFIVHKHEDEVQDSMARQQAAYS